MAKTNTVLIKLVSSADTGFYYVTKKNPRTKTNKLELKKFDPVARKEDIFRVEKIYERAAPPRPKATSVPASTGNDYPDIHTSAARDLPTSASPFARIDRKTLDG